MHRMLTCIVIAAAALGLTGCGGGGGGSTPPPVTSSAAGTWTVPNLNLPQNQMFIGSAGQVFVMGETPLATPASNRAPANYPTRIGTCNMTTGVITFSGSWTYNGMAYTITGTGNVNQTTHVISVVVNLVRNNVTALPEISATGSLVSDVPPTVPTFPNDGGGGNGGIDPPPPIPI